MRSFSLAVALLGVLGIVATPAANGAEENLDAVLDALIEASTDEDADVRRAAYAALSQAGGGQWHIIDILVLGVGDESKAVRAQALMGLLQAPAPAGTKARALIEAMTISPEYKPHIVKALGELGPEAFPHLMDALHRGQAKVGVIEALAQIASSAKPATEQLVKLLKDDDPAVRAASARALGAIHAEEPAQRQR